MDIYGINKINEYSKTLEFLEHKLEIIKKIEKEIDVRNYYEIVNDTYLDGIIERYSFLLKSAYFEYSDNFKEIILKAARDYEPHKYNVPIFAALKRRISRQIERIRKKNSRRFIDYRVKIRSFVNRIIRKNTEEDSNYVVLQILSNIFFNKTTSKEYGQRPYFSNN